MTENTPTLEEWRKLYQVALRVKELAPWNWMEEVDIFGVQNPDANELGFVSVMGRLGEHFAIALYLGDRGLYGFLAMESAGPSLPPESVLEVPQLQASFEDRRILTDQDRRRIKQLGFKFRGQNEWPHFRSYRPGYFPWYLEAEEARFLTHALEQLLDVAPRFRQNRRLLRPSKRQQYLVRTPHEQEGGWVWEDSTREVPPPEPASIKLTMDLQLLERAKQLNRVHNTVEIDLFLFSTPVQEGKGTRPLFPYTLLSVETQSGYILGVEMLQAVPSLEAMWGKVPLQVLTQLVKTGIVPAQINVRSGLLAQVLAPLAKELGIKIKETRALRQLDAAKKSLLERFERW